MQGDFAIRLQMYGLISGHALINHTLRAALPSLIPLLVDALHYTAAQRALLLSAFFPGYILTQLPGGWAAQRWGGKPVVTLNLYSNAMLFLLGPLAARTFCDKQQCLLPDYKVQLTADLPLIPRPRRGTCTCRSLRRPWAGTGALCSLQLTAHQVVAARGRFSPLV